MKVHCVTTDEGNNFMNAVNTLKQKEVLRGSLKCACHRLQTTVKKAMEHADCKELLKCQAITLQFKDGWRSRKRNVLRRYQELYVEELKAEVAGLRAEMARHAARPKQQQLEEAKKQFVSTEQSHAADEMERRAHADIDTEVKELALDRRAAREEDSDSDDEEVGKEALEGKEAEDQFFDFDVMYSQQQDIQGRHPAHLQQEGSGVGCCCSLDDIRERRGANYDVAHCSEERAGRHRH